LTAGVTFFLCFLLGLVAVTSKEKSPSLSAYRKEKVPSLRVLIFLPFTVTVAPPEVRP